MRSLRLSPCAVQAWPYTHPFIHKTAQHFGNTPRAGRHKKHVDKIVSKVIAGRARTWLSLGCHDAGDRPLAELMNARAKQNNRLKQLVISHSATTPHNVNSSRLSRPPPATTQKASLEFQQLPENNRKRNRLEDNPTPDAQQEHTQKHPDMCHQLAPCTSTRNANYRNTT